MASRWFHGNLSGEQAARLLMESGSDGSFLVRPSENHPGNFSISVRYKGEVTNIKIQNDGDVYCLAGSPDPFASLLELVTYYMRTPKSIKEKRGGFIELLYPMRSTDPTAERWYHGQISAKEAEKKLLAKGSLGSFLVRESQSMIGQFAFAVKCSNTVHHIIINHKNGKFDVASGQTFNTLAELVEFYMANQKLQDISTKTPINLKEPFHSTSFAASAITERINVLEKSGKRGVTGFREEFEQIQRFDHNVVVYTTTIGQFEDNKWKNRYKNILPYDHSRVILKGGDPKEKCRDYINANHIDPELETWKVKYIAAQGPLMTTLEHFWTMVYQQNTAIILMLTNEVEAGKAKCARYWPDVGSSAEYGCIVVDNMLEHDAKSFTMRELRVYHSEKPKKDPHMVYHYHVTGWPDHGVPQDPGEILGLLNEVHMKQKVAAMKNSPILLHCSAGIGRTGTVIVIDVLTHLLEERGLDEEIDIQKTVQLMRTKRSGMVQNEIQYRFVYSCLEHYVSTQKGRLKAQKESPTSETALYRNIDFDSRRFGKESHSSHGNSDKPVPRPPLSSMPEKTHKERTQQQSPVQPHRANAIRNRAHTSPNASPKMRR